MHKRWRGLLLGAGFGLTVAVSAGPYDTVFGAVQRLLSQAARQDEAGVAAARQQLEGIAKPAPGDVKAARALNRQGLAALQLADYAAAALALQKAQETNPADVEIAGNLGYASLKLGQLQRAEHQLIYAISLAPGRSSSWFNLGQVYGAQGTADKATGAFAAAYRFSQNPPKTLEFMRQALTAPENGETTRAALQRALALFGLR